MLLEVHHITEYRYDRAVRESVIELRMQPRRTSHQSLVSFELDVEPNAQILSYTDSWGNDVHHFDIPHLHGQLDIVARSVVETHERVGLPDALTMEEWGALDTNAARGESWDFLAMHGFVEQTAALRAFIEAQDLMALKDRDPLSALRELNRRLYEAIGYEAGVTEPDSPIDHALTEGRGVCQDFAHIMVAICRRFGVPARYVSGFLYTDQASHDRSTPGATHAWIEAYLPTLGWIGFDPTNDLVAGERHLAVAFGRDYSDVPPSQGVFRGEAESHLAVGVSVRKITSPRADHSRASEPTLITTRRRTGVPSLIAQHQQQ
jgi:transglutaminase-like putative cysteine protease